MDDVLLGERTKLLDTDETLELLGRPVNRREREWLWRAARENYLPHVKVGRRTFFNPVALAERLGSGGHALR